VEGAAIAAFAPVLTLLPVWLLATAVFWLPLQLVWDVPLWRFALAYLAAGVLLFTRPVQRLVLTRLLGARRPTAEEVARLEPAWREVAQANHLPSGRFLVAVLDEDELNAFACGGHLVVVTSFAVEQLSHDELCGVLAHELSHHLGSHTVALTVGQWLSLPVVVLAQVGFFLQNVATAATDAFGRDSASLTALGRVVGAVLRAASWVFLAGLVVARSVGNVVGRGAEYQADGRAVDMGFGRELARALRRTLALGQHDRATTWRERLRATHPPARTRVARIEARLRSAHRTAGR
jgi:Zn-dependent protease with chaperone function